MARYAALLAGLTFTAACNAGPSQVPVLRVDTSGDSVVVPFAEATDAAWLDGNRWAVLLPGGPQVDIVDLGSASRSQMGGKPSLENPFSLFRAGDTLYAAEPFRRQMAVFSLAGTWVRNIAAEASVRGALPRARDGEGNFYTELRPPPGPDGSGNRDSAAVVELKGGAADTVARLAPIDVAKVASPTGERFERRVFSGVDRWGVYPDGTVWIARVYHNRVDFRLPNGKVKKGEPLPDRVLEVTRADREAFVQKFPEELRSTAEQLPYSAIKAAFTSAFADQQGRIWLEGSRALADTVQRYNVVDRDGRLVFVATVSGSGRILAASPGSLLIADIQPAGIRLRAAPIPTLPDSSKAK